MLTIDESYVQLQTYQLVKLNDSTFGFEYLHIPDGVIDCNDPQDRRFTSIPNRAEAFDQRMYCMKPSELSFEY